MLMYHHEPASYEKIALLSSRSGPKRGLIESKYTVSTIYSELLIHLHPHSVDGTVTRLDCCVQLQAENKDSECRFLFVSPIFHVPLITATRLGM